MGVQVKQSQFEVFPSGEYPAIIKTIELAPAEKSNNPQYGDQLKIVFELQSLDHMGKMFTSWVSMKFNPKSRLYELTKAAMGGVEIPADYDFDSDDIVNRRVNLVIIEAPKKSDPNTIVNRVSLYKPAKKPTAKTAHVQPAAVTESFDM